MLFSYMQKRAILLSLFFQFFFLLPLLTACTRRSMGAKNESPPILPMSQSTSRNSSQNVQQMQISIEDTFPLRDVSFIDANKALVFPGYIKESIDDYAYPLLTNDGGSSWSRLQQETIKFRGTSFINSMEGWAVSKDSELWKTNDGGNTWTLISRLEYEGTVFTPRQILFLDENEGWGLETFALWHTEDGGKTWSKQQLPLTLSLFQFYNKNKGWICASNSAPYTIYRTSDGGKTWDYKEIANTYGAIYDLFFVNEQKGWLSSSNGIYCTKDGGTTWQNQKLPEQPVSNELYISKGMVMQSLCFINEQEGWAAGYKIGRDEDFQPILLHTRDGGENWQISDVKIKGRKLSKILFSNAQNGWLVAEVVIGEVEKDKTKIYHTSDRGNTWKEVLSLESPFAESRIGK